ncbi:MAG: hypothetical protein ACFFBH_07780 [Promethearchaeota archaeon]
MIFQTDYWTYLQAFFEWVGQSAGVMVFISGFIALTWFGYERKRRGSFTKRKLEEGKKFDTTKFLRVLSYLGLAVGIMDIWAGAWGLIFNIPPSFKYEDVSGASANYFTCIFLMVIGIAMFFKPISDLPLSSILALIAGSASTFILASLIPPDVEVNISEWINPKLLLFIVFIIITALVGITAKLFIGILQWISKILSWPPIAFIIMVFCFAQGIALWGFGVSIPNLL